jgi:hypothetical protein
MKNLYERLIETLGKSQSDSCFDDFVRDLGEKPELLIETKSRREFSFPDAGLNKIADEHLLFAIIEWGEGIGIRVFEKLQVDTEHLRDELILLSKTAAE